MAIINRIPSFLYNAKYMKKNDYDFLAWRSIRVLDNNYDSIAFSHNNFGDPTVSSLKPSLCKGTPVFTR